LRARDTSITSLALPTFRLAELLEVPLDDFILPIYASSRAHPSDFKLASEGGFFTLLTMSRKVLVYFFIQACANVCC